MAHRKRRAPTGGFRGRTPLGTSRLASTITPQQRILNTHYRLQRTRIQLIRRHMKPLPPNATPQQRDQALRQLFNLVRVGGTLGMRYQAGARRAPRIPDDALRTRQADCDELCMLFIAAARQLNISLTGVSMGVVSFNTRRPGTTATEDHAMLFVRGSGTNRHVFDLSTGTRRSVTSFSQTTIQNLYNGTRLTTGPGTAGFPIISIASMQTLTNASDMAALQLFHMADRHNILATNASTRSAKLAQYDTARGFVRQAITLGSANSFVAGRVAHAALAVFDGYHSLGDASYTAARGAKGRARRAHLTRALSYYTRAVQLYGRATSLAGSRASEMHDIHESRGLIYQQRRRYAAALSDYDQMIRLQPRGHSGHMKRIGVLIKLAQASAKSHRTRSRVNGYLRAAERACRTALASIPNTPAMASYRTSILQSQRGLLAVMRRRRLSPLP